MKVKEITASKTINVNSKPYWQYNIKIEGTDGHTRTESLQQLILYRDEKL